MDIELKEEHLTAPDAGNPVTAALLAAGFPMSVIAEGRITTNEGSQWKIAPSLEEWLARRRRGELVRVGLLRLNPLTAAISIAEAPPSWSRVTEFHNPPDHHIKFKAEIFCEDGAVKGMAQQKLDFDEERPRLAAGETIVLEYAGHPPKNPASTVTWAQYDRQGDPRRTCMCDYCRAYRSSGGRRRRPGSRLLTRGGTENDD